MKRLEKLLILKFANGDDEKQKNFKKLPRDLLKKKVMEFLKKNPYPSDESFHEYAENLNVSPHDLEAAAYAVISDFLTGGKGEKKPFSKFSKKQLSMGKMVEREHTKNKEMAKLIAKDHLTEIGDYYSRLKKMESNSPKKS